MKNLSGRIKYSGIFKDDKKICLALMSSFVILAGQYLILIYFNLLETAIGTNIQLLSKVTVGLAYLYALPSVFKRSKKIFFILYGITMIIFMIHYLCFPENRVFIISLIIPFFLMVLPSFIYALSIKNFLIFKNFVEKSSHVIFLIGSLISISILLRRSVIASYSMSLAYYMLLPSLTFLDKLFEKFSVKYSFSFILSLLVIILLGSRGPLFCITMFFFLRIFRSFKKISYVKAILLSSTLGIFMVIFIFFKDIVNTLYNVLLHHGIYSRTLYLLSDNRGFYLSGRFPIYQGIIAEIMNNPFLGIGLGGDRRITNGTYAHNLFIELICNFGFIIGGIFIISILYLILYSLQYKNNTKYTLSLLWIALGFIPLMVSGSYLISISFAIFLGILVRFKRNIVVI